MAIKMVREPSDTPNIRNTDDFVSLRYAYGNRNGYVISKGNECSHAILGSTFKIESGRLVLQGVECDIDANGVSITVDNVSIKRYFTVYLQVNLILNEAKILSTFDTADYPSVSSGEDLTNDTTGIARLELYHFVAVNAVISDVKKLVQKIDYNRADNVSSLQNNDVGDTDTVSFSIGDKTFTKKVNNVEQSVCATYASTDTSKGTIEERLTQLGFKSAAITVAGNRGNTVKKLGNFVTGNITFTNWNAYSALSTYFAQGKTLFTLPLDYVPYHNVTFPYILYVPGDGSALCGLLSVIGRRSGGNGEVIVERNLNAGNLSSTVVNLKITFGFDTSKGIYN